MVVGMSSRMSLPYTKNVREFFRKPRKAGPLDDASVVATAGSPACGNMIRAFSEAEGCVNGVTDELGGLPPVRYRCSTSAVRSLKRAIRAYHNPASRRSEQPPKDLATEERQTYEEKAAMERLVRTWQLVLVIGDESPRPEV